MEPADTYPVITKQESTGKPICVAHAWKFGHGMGQLTVEFDKYGDVIMCGGDFVIPYEPNPLSSEEDQAAVIQYLNGLGHSFKRTTQHPEVLAKLQTYVDAMENDVVLSKVLIEQEETICNDALIPGEGRTSACGPYNHSLASSYVGGGACSLVALAMLKKTSDADVAIQNAGGCRSDISAGNFTYADAMEFLPYSDPLVTLTLTGAQIHQVLEQAIDMTLGSSRSSSSLSSSSPGAYPYAAGLRFDVNASSGSVVGHRISNLQINEKMDQGTWNDILTEQMYTVVTTLFLANGHDGYQEFLQTDRTETSTATELEVFVTYVEEHSSQGQALTTPSPEDQSTQTFIPPDYTNGDTGDRVPSDDEGDENDSNDELGLLYIPSSTESGHSPEGVVTLPMGNSQGGSTGSDTSGHGSSLSSSAIPSLSLFTLTSCASVLVAVLGLLF